VDVSFGTIWEAIARDQPDSVAISEPGRDYTFAEFNDRAARVRSVPSVRPVPASSARFQVATRLAAGSWPGVPSQHA
jgi:hypothetical protein